MFRVGTCRTRPKRITATSRHLRSRGVASKFVMDHAAPHGAVSTLDDSKGTKAGNAMADCGGVEDVDDLVNVLVGVGLLFFQPRPASGAGDDAAFGQFPLDVPPAAGADGRSTRHASSR